MNYWEVDFFHIFQKTSKYWKPVTVFLMQAAEMLWEHWVAIGRQHNKRAHKNLIVNSINQSAGILMYFTQCQHLGKKL